MQITDFPIEIIIHDDASTDATADIISQYEKKHPGLIKPIYQKENQYSKGIKPSTNYVWPKCSGKYIALCEGDDYWTDPYKLQKQIDFMEKNPGYTLCSGGYEEYNVITGERKSISSNKRNRKQEGYTFGLEDMVKAWLPKTITVVFRKDSLSGYDANRYKYSRDTHLYYHLIKKGKGYYFNQIFGVYRKHPGGVYSSHEVRINLTHTCNVYKELYEHNKDDFTRRAYLQSIMVLFNYDLYHTDNENTFDNRIKLFSDALKLSRSIKDYARIFISFIPHRLKNYIRNMQA